MRKSVKTNMPLNKRRTAKVITLVTKAEAVIVTAFRKPLMVRTYLRPILLIIIMRCLKSKRILK